MSVRYRTAEPRDAQELAELHTLAWQRAYRGLIDDEALDALDPADRADHFRDWLPLEKQSVQGMIWIVAEEADALLGHTIAWFREGKALLEVLYLHPDSVGRGVGHALHDIALRGVRRLGADRVFLEVLDGNERAIRFYEQHGWSFTGVRSEDEWSGIAVTCQEMSLKLDTDVLAANRTYWDDQAAEYSSQRWADEVTWGIFGIPDEAAGAIFPEVEGRDVVELGCGTGYVSNWAIQRGARSVIGLDYSPLQLATAQQRSRESAVHLPLLRGDAQQLPFADNSFDLAINEYGAAIWCDPHVWIPEAARVLRPGGRIWFLGNSVQLMLCAPEFETELAHAKLQRAQRDMHRFEWLDIDGIEFHVSHGEMIAILTGAGFVVEALHELYCESDSETRYGLASADWASKWPIEEVWVAQLPASAE